MMWRTGLWITLRLLRIRRLSYASYLEKLFWRDPPGHRDGVDVWGASRMALLCPKLGAVGPSYKDFIVTTFADLGLAEPLLKALTKAGFETPTPIQAEVIPTMMAGHDIMGIAQTGTGKTAAFALPLLDKPARGAPRAAPHTCHALILTPTRELAAQVVDNIRTCGKMTKYSVALIVGGVRHMPQKRAIERGVDIIVATPGRLEDHMSTGLLNLSETKTLVLDEADQMLDMGFSPAIRRIAAEVNADHQTVLLSATMPKQIKKLAQDILKDPKEIAVARESDPVKTITQKVKWVEANQKRDTLAELLSSEEGVRAIVFTRTKHGADKTAYHLEKAGIQARSIHGDKPQAQREKALKAFKHGRVTTLVATDIAARGIDISDVTHVINFELPVVPEAYVHRIGRTGRAGRTGVAISLCDRGERNLLRNIERIIGQKFNEAGEAEPFDFSEEERNRAAGGRPGGGGRKGPGRGGRRGGPSRGHPSREGAHRGPKKPHRGKSAAPAGRKPEHLTKAATSASEPWDPTAGTRREKKSEQNVGKAGPKRPRTDRPHSDRQRDDRPRDERPRSDRTRSDRPRRADGAHDDKPRGGRPEGQKRDHQKRDDRGPKGQHRKGGPKLGGGRPGGQRDGANRDGGKRNGARDGSSNFVRRKA